MEVLPWEFPEDLNYIGVQKSDLSGAVDIEVLSL